MAYEIRDFDDIIDMVMEELKYQSTDTVSLNRIKRDINAIYLDEVVPFKRWNWLHGHTQVQHKAYYNAGTASVTPESSTVTLSVAPLVGTGSRAGYLFSVDGYDEIYTISTHTAGSDTIVLTSQYNGALSTTATFRIWADTIALPTDLKETTEVWQDFHRETLEAKGPQEFRKLVRMSPKSATYPQYYSTWDYAYSGTEVEATRYRVMKIHPSLVSDTITLHVDYIKEATPLDLDADEPLMPYEDRIVLVYGALSRAWARERNPEEALRNERLFKEKLDRMAGKVEDGFDKPQLTPDNLYVRKKRGPRAGGRYRGGLATGTGGAGSYTSPTYITNATIGPGNSLTHNLSVSSGVTIDGVDVSVLALSVAALETLADGKIYVGNSSNVATEVTISGDITISNTGVAAIGSGVIVNDDISAAASIARTKIATGNNYRILANSSAGVMSENAALTADHVIIADANGQLAGEATLAKTRGGAGASMASVTFPSSGALSFSTAAVVDEKLVRWDSTAGAQQTSTVSLGDTGAMVNTLTGDVVALKLYANSGGQTVNVFELFRSNGDKQFYIDNNGSFTTGGDAILGSNIRNAYSSRMDFSSSASAPAWDLSATTDLIAWYTMQRIRIPKADVRGLVVKAHASQSANTIEVLDSSDAVLAAFDKVGVLTEKEISTPATPPTGYHKIYPKSDDKWYGLNDAGVEVAIGTGTAGTRVVQSKTTTYTALTTDDVILADTSGGAWQLDLPAGTTGKTFRITKTTTDFSALTIDGDSGEQIRENGTSANTTTLNTAGESIELTWNGTLWEVTDRRIPSVFGAATTLTVGAVTTPPTKGTIVRDSVVSRRVGDCQESIVHYIQSGGSPAAGSGIYLYTIPNGLSVDTSDVTVSASVTSDGLDDATLLGQGFAQRSGAHGGHVLAYAYDSTQFYLRWGIIADTTGTTLSAESSNGMASGSAVNFGHNMSLHLHLKIPISGWKG